MKSNQPLKVVICGNYGATNLGDEAILDGILRLVRASAPQAEITVLSANPQATAAGHNGESAFDAEAVADDGVMGADDHAIKTLPVLPAGFRSFFRGIFSGSLFKTIDAIRKCDAFILGGGGLFTDEKPMAIVIWSLQANFAALFKKPIFCLGQSVGPLNTSFGRRVTRRVFARSKAITVRDFASWKLLQELGIGWAHQLADPAFALHVDVPLLHEEEVVPGSIVHDGAEKYIVMSLRPWHVKVKGLNGAKTETDFLYKNCAQFINWLWQEYGFRTILVPFQIEGDNDLDILNKIFEHVKVPVDHVVGAASFENHAHIVDAPTEKPAEIFEYSADPKKIIELIAKSQAVVGMRLHSLIFSTITCRPFLAIAYSEKVNHFVEDLNLEDFVIPWQQLSAATLEKRFQLLMKDREKIETALTEANLLMREKAREHERLLRDFFNGV